MAQHDFQKIEVIPSANDVINTTLLKINKETATGLEGNASGDFRESEASKVKRAQKVLHDKLSKVVDDFPILDVCTAPSQ